MFIAATTALLGFGLGFRMGMFGLIAASILLASGLIAALSVGSGFAAALPQVAGALAAFQLASFVSMALRHGRFAAAPGRTAVVRKPGRAGGATIR